MPRARRFLFPGAVHHVMLRGNQAQPIFYSDADRCNCCLLLQEGIERFGHRILAFCLMTNHIHLAIQEGEQGLSKAIQNLAFRHAQRVNRIQGKVGHVFQGRFKTVRIDSEKYLMNLIRYIHLNPVRAGIVKKPENYKWSGHNAYLGANPITWLESDYVLSKLSNERSEAVLRYNNFIYAGIGMEPEFDFKRGNQAGILGDDKFLEEVVGPTKKSKPDRNIISLPELADLVCKKYNVSFSDLSSSTKIRQLSKVRGALALLVRESEQYTLVELGGIIKRNTSGLSQLAKRFASYFQSDTKMQEEMSALKRLQYIECENLPSDP